MTLPDVERSEVQGLPGNETRLGWCLVCGGDFAAEILAEEDIQTASVNLIEGASAYAVHARCAELLQALVASGRSWAECWRDLPPGPLRYVIENSDELKEPKP